MAKLICPNCKREIGDEIGTAVQEFGYSKPSGEYFGKEYGDTLYHYCLNCGKELPNDITRKFFGEDDE